MDEETRSKFWAQFVTDPILWRHQAGELAHAAQVLYERATQATNTLTREWPASDSLEANRLLADMSMIPVAYMLAGFAIENAIKGVLIERLGPVDPFDPRVKNITSQHNMVSLAKDKFPELIEPNIGLLEKLYEFVLWLGRYPRPKTPNNYMKELLSVSQNDWSGYVNLLSEVLSKYGKQRRTEQGS
jgi:hypothetical protein